MSPFSQMCMPLYVSVINPHRVEDKVHCSIGLEKGENVAGAYKPPSDSRRKENPVML